jgi:hypothetical protein
VPEVPQFVFDRAAAEKPIFTADEIDRWPEELFAFLEGHDLIRETDNASSVVCDACGRDHVEPVIKLPLPDGTGFRAYMVCELEGRIPVPLRRLRQWMLNVPKLSEMTGPLGVPLTAPAGSPPEKQAHMADAKQRLVDHMEEFRRTLGIGWEVPPDWPPDQFIPWSSLGPNFRSVGGSEPMSQPAAAVPEPAAPGEPHLRPPKSEVPTPTRTKSSLQRSDPWWHDPSELRPKEYQHGPMIGMKKDICQWLGEKATRTPRRLEQKARSGQVFVIRHTERSWEVWFKDERVWEQADRKRRFG